MLTRFGVSVVHGAMFGADLVVQTLITGAELGVRGIAGLPVKLENYSELGESSADVSLFPGVDGGTMQALFFLAYLVVFLLLTFDVGKQLERSRLFGLELKNVVQRFPGMGVGVVLDMLMGQAIPVFDRALAAPAFDLALQGERSGVVGFELQDLLQFLQSQRIFFFLIPGSGTLQQLRNRLLADGAVEPFTQGSDRGVDVAFGL